MKNIFSRFFSSSCKIHVAASDAEYTNVYAGQEITVFQGDLPQDPLPVSMYVSDYMNCPKPDKLYEGKHELWKILLVYPADSSPSLPTDSKYETDRILAVDTFDHVSENMAEALALPYCETESIAIGTNLIRPQDHFVSFNEMENAQARNLFPQNLNVKNMHVWRFFRTDLAIKSHDAGFRLDTIEDGGESFTSTIQVYGQQTYLFYTQRNLKKAVQKYQELRALGPYLNKPPMFPLHPSLNTLGFKLAPNKYALDTVPKWYEALCSYVDKGLSIGQSTKNFPEDLMPITVTVTKGQTLVFAKNLVYARLNIFLEQEHSLALFA